MENSHEQHSENLPEENPLFQKIEENRQDVHALLQESTAVDDFLESVEFRSITRDPEHRKLLWTEHLLEKYKDQEEQLLERVITAHAYVSEKIRKNIRTLSAEQRKDISATEFLLYQLESDLKIRKRIRVYESLDRKIISDDQYRAVLSLNIPENITHLLGRDIQSGGSNAQGVFLISGTNLVAIRNREGDYPYIVWMPYLTSLFQNDPNIPRIYQVFRQWGYAYQIMERAEGKEMDKIPLEEIIHIPQYHFDDFVKKVSLIESHWLMIDPSKSSNFFYDPKKGFSLIDLAIREDNPYSVLNPKDLTVALTKRKNWSDPVEGDMIKRVTDKILLALEKLPQKNEDSRKLAGL